MFILVIYIFKSVAFLIKKFKDVKYWFKILTLYLLGCLPETLLFSI